MLDLLGSTHLVEGVLRVVVGVQGALIVLLHPLVQWMPGHVGVEPLELFAELRHVLIRGPFGGRQLVLQLGVLISLPLLHGLAPIQQ